MFGVPIADTPGPGESYSSNASAASGTLAAKALQAQARAKYPNLSRPQPLPKTSLTKAPRFQVCACGKPFRKERGKKERWTLFASDSLAHIRTSLACAFFTFLNLTYVYTCVCVWTHPFLRQESRATDNEHGPGSYAPIDSWVKKTYNVSYVRTWRLVPARNKTKAP